MDGTMTGVALVAPAVEASVQVSARMIKIVARFASKEKMRYALNGILLDSDPADASGTQFHLVATDGRRLACATFSRGEKVPKARAIFPQSAVARLRGGDIITIGQDAATVEAGDAKEPGTSLRVPYLEGTFPNWREFIPATATEERRASVSFNPAFIQQACAVFASLNGKKNTYGGAAATFQFGAVNAPSMLTLGGASRDLPLDGKRSLDLVALRVVVMPMCVDL